MKLNFTKMHGIGNDFVVIDAYSQAITLSTKQLRQIADRNFGVGCDQVLMVERPTISGVDFRYRIFNADGGEVAQCGNGARCFVRFVRDAGLTDKREIAVETASGVIYLTLEENNQVTVNMGAPHFMPADIPFVAETVAPTYTLALVDVTVNIAALSMGNPHAVQVVEDVERAPIGLQGPQIESHPRFPQRVNAGFMQIVDRHHIKLRVYERGSGETLACGTGACAAAVAGIQLGLLESPVEVAMRGGQLTIRWDGIANGASQPLSPAITAPVWMTGPASTVFQGVLDTASLDGDV